MSTYKQIFYHLIFSTKHREKTLTEKHHENLYKYIWGSPKKNMAPFIALMAPKTTCISSLICTLLFRCQIMSKK